MMVKLAQFESNNNTYKIGLIGLILVQFILSFTLLSLAIFFVPSPIFLASSVMLAFMLLVSLIITINLYQKHMEVKNKETYLLVYQWAIKETLDIIQHQIRTPMQQLDLALQILRNSSQFKENVFIEKTLQFVIESRNSLLQSVEQVTRLSYSSVSPPLRDIKPLNLNHALTCALREIESECGVKTSLKYCNSQDLIVTSIYGYEPHFVSFFTRFNKFLIEKCNISALTWEVLKQTNREIQWFIFSTDFQHLEHPKLLDFINDIKTLIRPTYGRIDFNMFGIEFIFSVVLLNLILDKISISFSYKEGKKGIILTFNGKFAVINFNAFW